MSTDQTPSRLSAGVYEMKAACLRLRRVLTDLPAPPIQYPRCPGESLPFPIAQSTSSLFIDTDPVEHWHQRGKVTNLRLAATAIDGAVLPAGATFSFWKQVGRATASRGFQPGRMLLEGCLIPSVGGGLCQLSNALYQVALDSGCQILERHAHSRTVPGSATAAGRDATVAWNYIDLRFRVPDVRRIAAVLTHDKLVVTMYASHARSFAPSATPTATPAPLIGDDHACDTCESHDCFRKHG